MYFYLYLLTKERRKLLWFTKNLKFWHKVLPKWLIAVLTVDQVADHVIHLNLVEGNSVNNQAMEINILF